jgi:excisionase family DNA binding protein
MSDDKDDTPPRVLTVKQFARSWSISERQVWRLIKAKRLKVIRIGRLVRIRPKDAEEFPND